MLDAYEEKQDKNGNLTGAKLMEILGDQFTALGSMVDDKTSQVVHKLSTVHDIPLAEELPQTVNTYLGDKDPLCTTKKHRIFAWDGRLYHVPQGTKFPMKTQIRNG